MYKTIGCLSLLHDGDNTGSDAFSLRRSIPDRRFLTESDHGQATATECLQHDNTQTKQIERIRQLQQ
jgi:hypothetical protein